MSEQLRMDAYYYGFDCTGDPAIDLILSAVACAGKAYHHTDGWAEECSPYQDSLRGDSPVAWIQNAANDAANRRAPSTAVRALVEAARQHHQCATIRSDGTCGGCNLSAALAAVEREIGPAGEAQEGGGE